MPLSLCERKILFPRQNGKDEEEPAGKHDKDENGKDEGK